MRHSSTLSHDFPDLTDSVNDVDNNDDDDLEVLNDNDSDNDVDFIDLINLSDSDSDSDSDLSSHPPATTNTTPIQTATTPQGYLAHPHALFATDDGRFIYITKLSRASPHAHRRTNGPEDILVHGDVLTRNRDVETHGSRHAILPLVKNELCLLRYALVQGARTHGSHRLGRKTLAQLVGPSRELVFTNHAWDDGDVAAWRAGGVGAEGWRDWRDEEQRGRLVCRTVYTQVVDVVRKKVVAWELAFLAPEMCTPGFVAAEGERLRGFGCGSAVGEARAHPRVEPYTFGDGCAGAGGVSWGAREAGLHVAWALDNEPTPCDTLRLNFSETQVLEMSITEFSRLPPRAKYLVDVMHVSFPCQGHSHMNRGQDPERDIANNALVLCLGQLLVRCRPRVLTLEQTNGILTKNNGWFFRSIVHQLTRAGYSASWQVLNLAEYGLAQARRRLIIMSVCPGQKMPMWPARTHGQNYSLRLQPFMTTNQAIANIPPEAKHHDVAASRIPGVPQPRAHRATEVPTSMTGPRGGRRLVVPGNEPLRALIMTSGVQGLHPSGSRYFTVREQMRLQGFDDWHELCGRRTEMCRQVGNAVPPLFMAQLYREVVKALGESDRR